MSAAQRTALAGAVTAALITVSCVGARPTTSPSGADAPTTPPGLTPAQLTGAPAASSTPSSVTPSSGGPVSTTAPGSSSSATKVAKTDPKTSPTSGAQPISPVALAALPAGGLYTGGRPPQFVLVSFDGAVDPDLLSHWEQIAAKSPAHLSFFLSAVYLLQRNATAKYKGPGHLVGASAIGFLPNTTNQPDADFLRTAVLGLQSTQLKGNEVGNHYGGHWCGKNGVDTWSAADWAAELDQVENLVGNVDANNNLVPPVGMPYNPLAVAGSRTPCLEGKKDALYPILKARGYRYDASGTRQLANWPRQRDGLWAYGFPTVTFPGLPKPMITVDFSISTNVDGDAIGKQLTDARAKEVSTSVRDGYLSAFDSVYYGDRAPFEISNHFNHSDHDAYNNAIEQVMTTVCSKPEVQCATYRELTDWLDAHQSAIASFEAGKFTPLARPQT